MTRRGSAASIVASPVLVGAVTVLVTVVAVFLAYNANRGLPFVPTYDLRAELPSGAKLVAGNEVRVGGFRVGVVDRIAPRTVRAAGGRERAIAVVDLKLDKVVEPLARDTLLRVRPRSALGLKYIEVTPGRSRATFAAGDTVPLESASLPLDLEDVFSTFDGPTRDNARAAAAGFGDAFAGRGRSLNTAIEGLRPLFRHLEPVMRGLADPETRLEAFFRELGRAAAQAAPVARTQAELFANMADTFAAIARCPGCLQATIEKSPATIDVSTSSFRAQRPFLADFADLSRRLRPAAAELPRALPPLNSAFAAGTPVLPQTVELNSRLEGAFEALDELFRNPSTLLFLKDLRTAFAVSRPAIEFIAPYQTVCNYTVYFLHPLGEVQSQAQTGPTGGGTVLQQGIKLPNSEQPNHYGTVESSRPVDVPPGMHPRGARDAEGGALHRLYASPYQPAIDAQGNADCQSGQAGYIKGPLSTGARYGPGELSDGTPSGGNFPVTDSDYPILVGGTDKSRELGIENLEDVP